LTTTDAPSWDNRRAIARPIPRDAPVTIATFPAKEGMRFPLQLALMLVQNNHTIFLRIPVQKQI
jgi:hypothetical protein